MNLNAKSQHGRNDQQQGYDTRVNLISEGKKQQEKKNKAIQCQHSDLLKLSLCYLHFNAKDNKLNNKYKERKKLQILIAACFVARLHSRAV